MSRDDRSSIIALLLLVSLLASGCTSASEATVPGGGQATATSQATEPSLTTGPSQTTQSPLISVDLELGPGNFNLANPRAGLADLASYQQTLVVTFVGTKDGQPQEWSSTYTFSYAKEPLASLLTIESTGGVDTADPVVVAETAGVLFQSYPDGSCTGEPINPEDPLFGLHEPAGRLSGLLGAEEAGTDTANDVAAVHYTFDERALAESGRAETEGEVWVAVDGGQVLKYVRTTTADAAYFGDGVEGTLTWAYDLTGINRPPEITLPPGCQIDAPSMPDVVNLQVLPNWMGFDTPSALADVTAFYQDQLPGRGWTINGDPLIGPETEVTVFAKGDELLNVIAISGDTATRVDILLTTATE